MSDSYSSPSSTSSLFPSLSSSSDTSTEVSSLSPSPNSSSSLISPASHSFTPSSLAATLNRMKRQPHFYPGQWIDDKDFNRIVQSSDHSLLLVCQALYPSGGILKGALDEFSLALEDSFKIRVCPGMALSSQGELCILTESLCLDFAPYLDLNREVEVRVLLRTEIQGHDYRTDSEDVRISGFQSMERKVDLQIHLDPPSFLEGVELFRIKLSPSVSQLQWMNKNCLDDPLLGEINLLHQFKIQTSSHRHRVSSQSSHSREQLDNLEGRPKQEVFIGPQELIVWRRSLLQFEENLQQTQKLYFLDDPMQLGVFISLLHAELIHRPFQMEKVQFFIEEVARRLCLFLERMLRKSHQQLSHEDRAKILTLFKQSELLSQRDLGLESFRMEEWLKVMQSYHAFIFQVNEEIPFIRRLKSAFLEFNLSPLDYQEKLTLAAYTFEKLEEILIEDAEKLKVSSSHQQRRTLSARFINGEPWTASGIVLREGEIEILIHVREIDRPLVLFTRHYIKRPGFSMEFTWNGNPLQAEPYMDTKFTHVFINQSLVLPAEKLIQGENRLTLQSSSTLHDWGFFGGAVYQPAYSGHSEISWGLTRSSPISSEELKTPHSTARTG